MTDHASGTGSGGAGSGGTGAGAADGAAGGAPDGAADSLIAASRVSGTRVYNLQGEALGTIHDVMIDKRSGQVAYAVMSFGGFLGIGDSHHPLPWPVLSYDVSQGGYVVDLDRDRLQGAPSHGPGEAARWADPGYTRSIDDYYGTAPYGGLI